jgi:hypothetical protein
VNRYGAMAQSHWKTWLPNRYAAILDPVSFFSQLGAEVSDRIAALELDLLGPERPGEAFLTRVGRRNMARLQAEEMVLQAMVLLPPEAGTSPEDGSDELPPEWAIPSAQETVAQVAARETETT